MMRCAIGALVLVAAVLAWCAVRALSESNRALSVLILERVEDYSEARRRCGGTCVDPLFPSSIEGLASAEMIYEESVYGHFYLMLSRVTDRAAAEAVIARARRLYADRVRRIPEHDEWILGRLREHAKLWRDRRIGQFLGEIVISVSRADRGGGMKAGLYGSAGVAVTESHVVIWAYPFYP